MRYDHGTRKKQNSVSLVLCVFIGLVGVLGMSVFSLAEAQNCGGTIGPGGTVTLTGDLTCTGNGLTVIGPVTLDLNGHTVSGPGSSKTGITAQGKKAQIVNGTVTGWDIAVYVRGDGYHKIINLKIENNNYGIVVRPTSDPKSSTENHVINNFVKNNVRRGIRLRNTYANKVINNYVENSGKGISIDSDAHNNAIISNTLIGNNTENCDLKGNNNVLINNSATNGTEECFVVGDLESGLETTGNILQNNSAFNCEQGGFVVSAASHGNYISHNTAHCYLEACNNIADLQELSHPTCGANTWFMNVADSASPDCILQ